MSGSSQLLKAIQHPVRQSILRKLINEPNGLIYTDLLPFCENSTGKLNYHLRILEDLVEKVQNRYGISDKGKSIVKLLNQIEEQSIDSDLDPPKIVFNRIFPSNLLYWNYVIKGASIFVPLLIYTLLFSFWSSIIIPLVIEIIGYSSFLIFFHFYVKSIWYRITDTEIETYKGIITKSHKVVPYRTVTNIELKQGIFNRLFGISTVDIHTASYSKSDSGEHLIGMLEGDEIRETLLERIRLLNPIYGVNDLSSYQKASNSSLLAIKNELHELNHDLAMKKERNDGV